MQSSLPSRYKQLNTYQAQAFSEQELVPLQTIERYYHTINLAGKKLKDNPELQKEFSAAVKDENKPPHWDLCKVSIPGTNKFCDENIGIPRDKMPQLGGKPKPGSEGEAKAKKIADQNVRKKMGLPNDGEIPADKKQEYDDL